MTNFQIKICYLFFLKSFIRKLLSITFILFIFSTSSYSQVPLKGLINYYPFSGDANDFIGTKNGVVYGATLTSDRFGNANSAYLFDGIKNYIEIPNYSSTTFNSDFSISVWVKINNYFNDYPHIIHGENNSLAFHATGKGYPASLKNRIGFYTTYGGIYDQQPSGTINGISTQIFPASNEVSTNTFHHIVITKENDSISFFLDGLVILKEYYQNNPVVSGNKLTIGRAYLNIDATDYTMNGTIDDIRIYNRSLLKSEVTALYNENNCFKQVAVTDTLIIHTITTAINTGQETLNNIKVYPNPTKDVLNIAVSNTATTYSITINNSLGQSVYSSQLNTALLQVNLNTLGPKGLYVIQILDNKNNVVETKKLILE